MRWCWCLPVLGNQQLAAVTRQGSVSAFLLCALRLVQLC